ncbi:MAG: RdgB/HAM1 family non-canonical purine NTP pyrophosphatase [Elusimicrobia bacterium]|nr:RdgB/HAM1 family non-canonical purine NTP pyrophosphatase [Elusimicrobiota bacterium]
MVLVLASHNAHKIKEIRELLSGLPLEISSLDDFPGLPATVEDELTLEGNARKKAQECAQAARLWALADDTGLEVEALGGAPGVYSARYAGPGCDFADNNRKLLEALKAVPAPRRAAFRTVAALCDPQGRVVCEEGRLEGEIVAAPRGASGFGYDPIFLLPSGKTLAELSLDEKNRLSHRAAALRKILPHIKKLALAAVVAVLFAASPARATKTEPGSETIWDQIMAAQANRGLRVGSRYLDDSQYELALKEFSRAVSANPKDPVAHMMLGVAYYWTGQVDKSLESYRKSLELDPNSAQAYMLVGISMAWRGDVKSAYAAFQKSANLDPNRADIQMNLGSVEDGLGHSLEALDRFRKAAGLEPGQALYHFQLGTLYRKLGRDQEAAESLRRALRLYPAYEDALLELGAIEERQGQRKAAVYSFRKAVNLKARDSVARLRLGRLYLLNGEAKKAREIFADAFHLTPEEGGPGLQLSVAYSGVKAPAPSAPAAGREPQTQPPPGADSDPLDVFAKNLERIPLDQGAILQVDVVMAARPQLVKASESASALKKALEREMTGRTAAAKAVRREYKIPAAAAQARAEAVAKVLQDLRAVMKEAPAGSDVRLGMNLTFTKLGAARPAGGQAEDSAKVSYQPRQVGNDMGLWVMGTGWMYLVEETLPEPGEIPNHPDQSDWWVATGLAYAAIGDSQQALGAFERACQLDPKNEAAFLGRGVARVMTGDEAEAAASLQEALKINPKNRAAGEGLKWLQRPSTRAKKG